MSYANPRRIRRDRRRDLIQQALAHSSRARDVIASGGRGEVAGAHAQLAVSTIRKAVAEGWKDGRSV